MIQMYSFTSSLTVIDNNINEIGSLQKKLREVVISKQLQIRKKLKNQRNIHSSEFFDEVQHPKIVTPTPFESHKPASAFATFRERYENQRNESSTKSAAKIPRKFFTVTKYISKLFPNKLSTFMNRIFMKVTNKLKDWRN